MTIDLASLILKVQVSLSDLPDDFATDEQMFFDLQTAQQIITSIKRSDFDDEDFESEAIVRLGAYLTYVNYTSLAERQLGSLPTTSTIKVDALRRIALMFMRQMTDFTIGDDLSISTTSERNVPAVAGVITNSVWSE